MACLMGALAVELECFLLSFGEAREGKSTDEFSFEFYLTSNVSKPASAAAPCRYHCVSRSMAEANLFF